MAADPPRPPARGAGLEGDLELVRAALGGRARAVEALARRLACVPRILAAQSRRRGAPLASHDLEDLSQEVVAVILEKLETFSGASTLESWIHGICHFQLMNRIRRAVREAERFPPLAETADEGRAAANSEADCFEYELVRASLENLPRGSADVVRLKHYEGLSFSQLAERLGISPNTAKARYYRAIEALQRSLSPKVREGRP